MPPAASSASSAEEDDSLVAAPPTTTSSLKKLKKLKKKRSRDNSISNDHPQQQQDEEKEKEKGEKSDRDRNPTPSPPPTEGTTTTTTVAAAAAGEGGAAKKRKRKRTRTSSSSKKSSANQDNEEEEGGDTTTTGGAADDEASLLSFQQHTPTQTGPPPATAEHTVYVEGISYEASEEDIQRFFQDKGCGKVTAVRMPRYQDSGRPRGYAHVDFKKEDGVVKAVALSGQYMKGRYLNVQKANEPKMNTAMPPPSVKPPGCDTVFVKNLPYNVTEAIVSSAFTFCGKIKTVRLAVWQHTQQQKGFCYVQFEKESSAEIAVKKQGSITVGGRRVFVDYETGAPKMSYRGTDGRQWHKVHGKEEGKHN